MVQRILAIGNSFSQDATAYVHQIAQAAGVAWKVVNLYIGGCSLETHWNNMRQDAPLYQYERNGQPDGRLVSIAQAVQEEIWDVITLQQVSGLSGEPDSYDPYLTDLYGALRRLAPDAAYWLHQTWAYERDSAHQDFPRYHCDQQEMFERLRAAYARASRALGGLPILKSGQALQAARRLPGFQYGEGGRSLCRDGYHLSIPEGRYLVGALWFETLAGIPALHSPYLPEGMEARDRDALRACVHALCQQAAQA